MSETEKRKLVEELHRPVRRNYTRRKVEMRDLDETWQADLVDMAAYVEFNRGYRYILNVIDTFSKYAWAAPLKTKSGKDVAAAMGDIFAQGRVPKNLHVDAGKEFYNTTFNALMNKNRIHLYSTFTHLKASICERFNRTLKTNMWKQFSLRGTYKWIDILQDLVTKYNASKHRTIGLRPRDVNRENASELRERVYQSVQSTRTRMKPKFKIGDKVRVSKFKHVFEKGFTPNWTTEIFTVTAVKNTDPITYRIEDYQKRPIKGGFYAEELHRALYPDVYLVEKVLKRRGTKLFVKWLGFDSSHNSWIQS